MAHINQDRVRKNLMGWLEITEFCLELRKSVLKKKYTSLSDDELTIKVFSEIVANKEKEWKSQIHLPDN
ncbi:conserved hypothetical protein [Candidatus Magnetomoraceae bacterium gMMP-15]